MKIMLPPHNIILFELDFDIKFPLVCLLQLPIDLKSTIFVPYFWIKKRVLIRFLKLLINERNRKIIEKI